MDDRRFDALARFASTAPSRRGLLAGLLAALVLAEATDAKPDTEGKGGGRPGGKAHGRNRGNGHGNGRNRKGKRCDPKPDSEVCAGRCGLQENNCGRRVSCEPCACATAADCPGVACQDKACAAGFCAYENQADGAPCDDGDACTTGSTCQDGACGGGAPVACANGESCAPQTGCDCAASPACPTNTVRQPDCSCRCPVGDGYDLLNGGCFRRFASDVACVAGSMPNGECGCGCAYDGTCIGGYSGACSAHGDCTPGSACFNGECHLTAACPA